MTDLTPPGNREPQGLNPDLKRGHDGDYTEAQNGSTPLDTVSIDKPRPAVWPVIWAVVTVALIGITLFLLFA